MRQISFLRTPIRAEHQTQLLNLHVAEQPLAKDPGPADTYPQTLLVSFGVGSGTSEVQIAPLWEGSFKFLADSTEGYPTEPAQVTEENFSQWQLVGDLVLESGIVEMFDMQSALANQIPLITPPPSIVRYSKIRITRSFLFVTLNELQTVALVSDGKVIDPKEPQWRQKLIIAFLHGAARVFCNVSAIDPAQDSALKSMPSVRLEPAGSVTTLKVTIASKAWDIFQQSNWFAPQPEIDDLFPDPLVDPALDTPAHRLFDARHPSHSVISPLALYSNASATAFASDHGPSTPLRSLLTSPRTDGKTYRRIELLRSTAPPVLGNTSSNPQRPFPMHQLVWQRESTGTIASLRIPLSGRLYLPLANGVHTFWAIPRSHDPAVIGGPDTGLRLSVKRPEEQSLSLPQSSVTVSLAADDNTKRLYANLLDYDSKRAWVILRDKAAERAKAKAAAERRWNVEVLSLFIRPIPGMAQYAPIYGHIRAAAMRHGLAPEFLHAVFMGEGIGGADGLLAQKARQVSPPPYDAGETIGSTAELGLDWIADDLPPPSGIEAIPLDDRDIGLQTLIDEHYVDPIRFGPEVLADIKRYQTEAKIWHMTGNPIGWVAAIELVAAEVHARLDMMLEFLEAAGTMREHITESQRRFLAYVRYNTEIRLGNWQTIARSLDRFFVKWSLERPDSPSDDRFTPLQRVTYNSLQHIPVAEWYEQVGVYS